MQLLEEENDLSGSGWFPNANAVVTPNYANDPAGNPLASRLIDNNAGGTGNVQSTNAVNLVASSPYSMHAFFKADQLSRARLQLGSLGALDLFILANMGTGALDNVGADVVESWITDYGAGWYWGGAKFTSDATDLNGSYIVRAENTTVDLDGTSSILVVGCRLEDTWDPTPAYSLAPADMVAHADMLVTGAGIVNAAGILRAAAGMVWVGSGGLSSVGPMSANSDVISFGASASLLQPSAPSIIRIL